MLTWMRDHTKTIMTGTVALVVPSFILLYGYDQFNREQSTQTEIATVYDRIIQDSEYYRTRDQITENNRESERELSNDELRDRAISSLISRALRERAANELGISTSDRQLAESIQSNQVFASLTQNGTFDIQRYQQALLSAGMTPEQFESMLRDELNTQKFQQTLLAVNFPSGVEKKAALQHSGNKAYVELLKFDAAGYVDEVEINEEELAAFFKENIKDYRIPEKRRIRFLEFRPDSYRDRVRVTDNRLEKYFNDNQTKYQQEDKRAVEYIIYDHDAFKSEVEVTDEALQAFLKEKQAQYRTREQVRAQYAVIPFDRLVPPTSFTEEEIEAYYNDHTTDFTHAEEVRASHILLRISQAAGDADRDEARTKIESILAEIQNGLDFGEAAQKYSEDGSSTDGGDLGYFPRGRMVKPFEEAAFNAEIGSVTGPIESPFGFHLIRVEDHRQAGTSPLSEVREEIVKTLTRDRVDTLVKDRYANLGGNLESNPDGVAVETSDWIERGGEVAGVSPNDWFLFSNAAFETEVGTIGEPLVGEQAVYLVKPLEKQEPRDQSLSEVYDKVRDAYILDKALAMAAEAAKADLDRLNANQVTWEDLGKEHGGVHETGLIDKNTRTINEFRITAQFMVQKAFEMKAGQVDGPIEVDGKKLLMKVVGEKEAYIPEFAEVSDRVTEDYIKDKQQSIAGEEALRFSSDLIENKWTLEQGADKHGLKTLLSDYFAEEDMIPGLGRKPEITQETFALEKGEVSKVVETTRQDFSGGMQPQTVPDSYFLIEVDDIKPSYLPELEVVKESVERDYKLHKAVAIAERYAKEAEAEIAANLATATPISATQTLDFEAMAKDLHAEFARPASALSFDNRNIPGMGNNVIQLARTVLSLEPGQITPAIPVHEWERGEDRQMKQGSVKGYVIAQVTEKQTAQDNLSNEDKSRVELMQFNQSMFLSQLVSQAWIEEASQVAVNTGNLTFNEAFFGVDEEASGTADESTGDGTASENSDRIDSQSEAEQNPS